MIRYQAICTDCRWTGPSRTSTSEARLEARAHRCHGDDYRDLVLLILEAATALRVAVEHNVDDTLALRKLALRVGILQRLAE